jgi:hypothetical protein
VRSDLGDRAAALSRLTLRVVDIVAGDVQVILLPDGARAWYVRAQAGPRRFRAEIGLTLPSGEFRSLAASNTVVTPASGSAPEVAKRTARYRRTGPVTPVPQPPDSAVESTHPTTSPAAGTADSAVRLEDRGGASDRFRR